MKKNPGRKERRRAAKHNRDAAGRERMRIHNGLKENQGIRKRGGFTLIELIVVIAILVLLLSLAIPSFLQTREKAQQVAFDRNVQTLHNAGTIYALENPDTATIWSPFANQVADKSIEITDNNLHDSWNGFVAKWPADPTRKGGTYTVEIDRKGNVTVSPSEYGN